MDFLRYQRSMDESTHSPMNLDYDYTYADGDTRPGVQNVNVIYFLTDLIFPASIAIIGISFFIFILTKKELRKYPTCWLVINVFVAVLVHGLVVLPVNVYTINNHFNWTTGLGGCFIFKLLSIVNTIHIQLSVLLLMIDRFVYFLKQNNHPEIMTAKMVKIAILSSVACEIVLSVTCVTVNMPRIENLNDSQSFCLSSLSLEPYIVENSLSIFLPVGVNIFFGLVTFVCTLVMCHKLNEGNSHERSNKKQAVALNILVGLLNVTCCFSFAVFVGILMTFNNFSQPYIWDIMFNLNNMFYLLLPILVMVLIPEIRSEMACCKKAKKGEKTPLI